MPQLYLYGMIDIIVFYFPSFIDWHLNDNVNKMGCAGSTETGIKPGKSKDVKKQSRSIRGISTKEDDNVAQIIPREPEIEQVGTASYFEK